MKGIDFVFVDSFQSICEEKGIAPTKALSDIGMGRSALSSWKKGAEPSNSTKRKLADYFGITLDELKEGKIKMPTPDKEREHSELEKECFEGIMQLTDDRKRLVLAQIRAWKSID
jgi:transcriptional regulator with XRE-family HTH domain